MNRYEIQNSRTEAKDFERLLNSIAEWFIDNPKPSWQQQLREAARKPRQEVYAY